MATKKKDSLVALGNQASAVAEFGAPAARQLTTTFPSDADGLSQLKPGFSVAPEFDVAFALGFPYVRCPQSSETVSAADAIQATRALSHDRWRLPPTVSHRAFRLLACNGVRMTPVPGVLDVTEQGERAIAVDGELTAAEVESSFKALFWESAPVFTFFLADLPLLAESSLGANATVESLIAVLESVSDALLIRNDPERAALVLRLGFLLLRTPRDAANEHRARLRSWLDERVRILPGGVVKKRSKTEGVGSIWRSVDLAVNGDEAVERSAYRVGSAPDVGGVLFASTTKCVSQAIGARPKGLVAPQDARLAFVGGEEVLGALVKQMGGIAPERLGRFVETFGVIRSPLIVKWLKTIAKKEPSAESTLRLHGA